MLGRYSTLCKAGGGGLHPLPPAASVALGTPCPPATSLGAGNHAEVGDMGSTEHVKRRKKKSPNRKGSFFWHKSREEPASWRSCRQKPWLEIGLGQHSPTAHLHCRRRSRAAPVLHRPSRSQAGRCPCRGETQAVPTANFQTGDNPTNLVGFWGEDAENPPG